MNIHWWSLVKAAWLGPCLVAVWLLIHPYAAYAQDNSRVVAVDPLQAGLGQDITVTVEDSSHLLAEAGCSAGQTNCLKNIMLYLDGTPITGLAPFAREMISGTDTSVLKFHLQRTAETKDGWSRILSKPGWQPRAMPVSVGIADKPVLSSNVADFKLVVITKEWAIFYGLLLLALLVAFGLLVKATNLIRDAGAEPGGTQRKPYSLARSQMAWWFFVVVAAYLFIGLVTGDFATSVTGTVLVLIGISTVTAVGSAVVDAQKENSPETKAKELEAEKTITQDLATVEKQLQAQPTANAAAAQSSTGAGNAAPSGTNAQSEAASLIAKKDLLKSQEQFLKNASQGWYRDILSDANGISFHRFQIAGWTLVLGTIFVVTVYKTLAMPEFGESLLTLMGISAGAYIGFKIPEPTTPTPVSK